MTKTKASKASVFLLVLPTQEFKDLTPQGRSRRSRVAGATRASSWSEEVDGRLHLGALWNLRTSLELCEDFRRVFRLHVTARDCSLEDRARCFDRFFYNGESPEQGTAECYDGYSKKDDMRVLD